MFRDVPGCSRMFRDVPVFCVPCSGVPASTTYPKTSRLLKRTCCSLVSLDGYFASINDITVKIHQINNFEVLFCHVEDIS